MAERKPRGIAGDKTVCLPIADDIDFQIHSSVEALPHLFNLDTGFIHSPQIIGISEMRATWSRRSYPKA